MFAIIGILAVFGAIVGGYLMEHGNLKVLMQPAELLIIGGAALGTVLIANPLPILIAMSNGIKSVFGGSRFTEAFYLDHLKMIYELYNYARKSGTAKLEEDIDKPEKSQIFSKHPDFLKDHHAVAFLCDTLRMAVTGGVDVMEIDSMMEIDLEVHQHESSQPIQALSTMADALPGLGIVAAVLGVCITMSSLGGPKEEIGHKVASALVGTFLGILMCYGLFGPISSAMGKEQESEGRYYGFLRMASLAFVKGVSPMMAVELARRSIPHGVRPSFQKMETTCRSAGAGGTPAKK
ncbi:MAG: flagellar motor stator protein MotA [Bryobacteraceae bacterium]